MLAALIQMGIDVRRCADGGMPEEVGYVDQRHLVIDQHACKGMTEVMEANVPQRMLFQQIAEVGADIVWFEQIPQRVRADVVFPLWVILI